PCMTPSPDTRTAVAAVINDAKRQVALYPAPVTSLGKPDPPWTRICDFADKVVRWAVHGEDIYLLTYRDSPRFSIIRMRLGAPDLAQATTVVPASDRVLTNFAAAKDALYIEVRDGNVKRLLRRTWGSPAAQAVAVPVEGGAD